MTIRSPGPTPSGGSTSHRGRAARRPDRKRPRGSPPRPALCWRPSPTPASSMKTLTTALAALVLASLCPALSLADEAPDAPSEGAGASFSCEAGLTLPLAGLTEDKVGQVERALRGMTQPRYRCPACKMISPWPMTCVGCGEPHEKMDTGAALYTSVQVDGASSSVCLEIDSKGTARMTEIAAALEPTGVSLDRAAISIVGWTRVTVRIDPEQLASARRALQKPGLFASIGVRRSKDGVSTTFVVQHPPRRPGGPDAGRAGAGAAARRRGLRGPLLDGGLQALQGARPPARRLSDLLGGRDPPRARAQARPAVGKAAAPNGKEAATARARVRWRPSFPSGLKGLEGAGENGVERATSPLQSFGMGRGLWRTPAPPTPRLTLARFPGPSVSTGHTRRSRGSSMAPTGSPRPTRTRFPRSVPSYAGSLPRHNGLPGLWPVLRVCTHDLRADGVHPRRLSWGSCPPVLGAWSRALRRRSLAADRHLRSASRRWLHVEPAGPRVRPLDGGRGGLRCAPFQSFRPRSDGCRLPGPCPRVVGEAALQAARPPLQGFVPRSDPGWFWRNLRMLS